MKFVLLSSSRGTTIQSILNALSDGGLRAECVGLVTDKEDRGCADKVRAAGLPVRVVPREKGETREAYDTKIDGAIRELASDCEIVACIGWMFILSPWFVQQWQNKILNVHPSLLPKHPGGHAVQDALEAGDSETGMTIHLIDEGVDTGPIVVQKICSIKQDDTVESLQKRIQDLEKEWYPKVLQQIHTGEIVL